jgi:subtilisin family serine protease
MVISHPRIFSAFLFILLLSGPLLAGKFLQGAPRIPNEYLITLRTGEQLDAVLADATRREGQLDVFSRSEGRRPSFAIRTREDVARRLSEDFRVLVVEENIILSIQQSQVTQQAYAPSPYAYAHLWHLDRIDDMSVLSRFNDQYTYCDAGADVRLYVLDNGILPSHPEFAGRLDSAPSLQTYLNSPGRSGAPSGPCWSDDPNSSQSHGTSVASVAAGTIFGVAKYATVVDARAFDCNGATTLVRVSETLDWIRIDASNSRSVVNMSFAASKYDAGASSLSLKIQDLVDDGIPVVAAAGNVQWNSGTQSFYPPMDTRWVIPAGAPGSITVGGSNRDSDTHWAGSNYNVHFYAPSQLIEAASTMIPATIGSGPYLRREFHDCGRPDLFESCTSGTSFAAPLVSGLIARFLSRPSSSSDRATVVAHLQSEAASSTSVNVSYSDGSTTHTAPLVGATPWCY